MQDPAPRPIRLADAMSIDSLPQPSVRVPGTFGAAASPRATTFRPLAEALSGPDAPDPIEENARNEPASAAVDATNEAARVYEELRSMHRELRFRTTEDGVRIEVYDGHGELVRTVPPGEEEEEVLNHRRAAWLA
jgi:hypothetical protein